MVLPLHNGKWKGVWPPDLGKTINHSGLRLLRERVVLGVLDWGEVSFTKRFTVKLLEVVDEALELRIDKQTLALDHLLHPPLWLHGVLALESLLTEVVPPL